MKVSHSESGNQTKMKCAIRKGQCGLTFGLYRYTDVHSIRCGLHSIGTRVGWKDRMMRDRVCVQGVTVN